MKFWTRLLIAYAITFAVYNIGGFESSDILMGVVFLGAYMLLSLLPDGKKNPTEILQDSLYTQIRRISDIDGPDLKKVKRAAAVVTAIWTLLYVIYLGGRIDRDLSNPLFSAFYIVLTVMGLYIALYFPIRAILAGIMLTGSGGMRHEGREKASEIGLTGFSWRKWLILTGIILLCMLPLFLLNFPGTLTVDSFDQLSQARGITPFDDHHPWVHTLIIKAFYSIGFGLTHSVYGGIAAYSILQMLIMAASVAYAIVSMTDIYENAGTGKDSGRTGRIVTVLMLLGFVLCPYNLVYSFTMWKDVLFAASVLILTVTIYRIYVCSIISVRDIVLSVISGLGTCLIRHNGLYAYVLTMIVIILYEIIRYRKNVTVHAGGKKAADSSPEDVRRLIMTAVSVALVLTVTVTVKGPVMKAYNVEPGNVAHNLPIPLQQVARVVYDGCELTDEETAALEKLNTLDFLRTEYTPGGADPTMQWLVFGDTEYLNAHKGEYLALWLKLGLEHPEEYIRAYVNQTKGYYTTMAPEQTEYYGILGNEEGLEPQPVLGASVRIKLNEIVYKLHNILPVYGILYSMGACFMLLIMGAAIISFGDKSRLLTYLPVAALTLTILVATPLVADLRYAYPLMLSMPALTVITLKK